MPTKIYKLIQTVDEKSSYVYFSEAAMPSISKKVFASAGGRPETFGIAAFEADVKAMDLTAFLDAGGVLSGPVEIK